MQISKPKEKQKNMVKLKSRKIRRNPLYKIGSSVEVRSTDPGFLGSWYEAIIISETPRRLRPWLTVQYKTLLSSPPHPPSRRSKKVKASPFLQEKVHMSLIRPPSPCERDKNAVFEAFEEVEAYHNDGWWPGVILKRRDEICDDGSFNYNVAFPISREVFSFGAYDLRKKMVWVTDEQGYSWKSPDQLSIRDHDSEEELYKTTFHVGDQVEVSYDKDNFGACWFAATILQIIGRTYSLLEYDTLRADNNDDSNPLLEEVVDMQYIRPCPPKNMSEPTTSFKVLDKVEASYNSGDSTHMVHISKQNKDVLVPVNSAALRIPLIWEEDGQWKEISQEKDDKSVRRSKGQKFKHAETGVTRSLTNDQSTRPLKKLRKMKDIIGDKSLHKSSSPRDKDGNFLTNCMIPSFEKRLKSGKVRHDSTTNHSSSPPRNNKDVMIGQSLINKAVRPSKRPSGSKDDYHGAPNFVKHTLFAETKNLSSLEDKYVVDNAETFEEIINLDVVKADHSIQNESASDKGLSNSPPSERNVMENETNLDEGYIVNLSNAVNKENGMESEKVFGEGNEFALSSLTRQSDSESPVSIELVESTKEVLRLFPQNPHFQPLLHYGKVAKKGMICGLSIGFSELVNSIKDLTICSSDLDFEEKNNELTFFEQFGFNTEQVRARLKKLKELHNRITQSQEKTASTLSTVEELKIKIACNYEEINKKIAETKKVELEVEQLRSTAMAAEDESTVLTSKFGEILNSPW